MNEKVYIHEFIDIVGPNRANYMHHMAANFSPAAQVDRQQLCYGIWGVVGSTGRWPEVVNIWEEEGLDGLAVSFRHELGHASLQDPKLATWWAKAAELRRGGRDRLVAPAPWTKTITELCHERVGGEAYAHDLLRVPPGSAHSFLDLVRDAAVPAYAEFGWQLVGAWRTLMVDDAECILLWAVPSWEQWAVVEQELSRPGGLSSWQRQQREAALSFERVLLVDAPLSPFRTHRQPRVSDQTDWEG